MKLDHVRDGNGKLPAYSWPGCYPIVYVMGEGEVLCPACMNDTSNPIIYEPVSGDDPCWTVQGFEVYYEGPEVFCAHCNKGITSAYGDPDSE